MLGVFVVLAMVAAFLQSPLTALMPGAGAVGYLDDALLGIAFLCALANLRTAPGTPVLLAAGWVILMALAAAQSTLNSGGTLVVFRQVTVPAVLVIVGMALAQHQWDVVKRLAIWFGIINVGYMMLEFVGVYLLDPTRLETFNAGRGEVFNGLPSYYRYWVGDSFGGFLDGETLARLGGTYLNPPVAGLAVATAFVFLWHSKSLPWRRFWLVALGAATALTFARGGWVIVLVSVLMPHLLRKWGRLGTAVVMIPALWFAAITLADSGSSARHADGLVVGLGHALDMPLGAGFGLVGNYVKSLHIAEASESLLGIAFSAAGICAVALTVVLIVRLWNIVARTPHIWEGATGLAIVIAALLSESAGALNGTMPLWLCVGVALSMAHRHAKRPSSSLDSGELAQGSEVRTGRSVLRGHANPHSPQRRTRDGYTANR